MLPQTFSAATTCRGPLLAAEPPAQASAATRKVRTPFSTALTLPRMILSIQSEGEGATLVGMRTSTATSRWAETTLASLRSKGHRDGGARRAVIELLGRQPCCLTAQEIFDELRGEGRRAGI